ncbi:hypothetical protein PT273_02930 [Orbaceae bacterium ESL0727]|nr:hypothetical protein [Orbaceae bacterium ESL0727]
MRLISKTVIIFSCLVMLSACQTKKQHDFDPEAAALARMKLGLGYLAHADESEDNIKLAHYNLQLAAKYSPNNPKIMLAMAMFDQHVGEYQEAEMLYKRITTLNPGDGLAQVHYGGFLCARNRYTEAQKAFQQSIDLDRHQWKADGLEQYGYCAIQNGDKQRADQLFQQLFTYDAARRDSVLKVANMYQQKGADQIATYLFSIVQK